MRLGNRGVKIGVLGPRGESRGSVFQTDLPYRQASEGLKTLGY